MQDTPTGASGTSSTSSTFSADATFSPPPTDSTTPSNNKCPPFSFGLPNTSDIHRRFKKSSDTVASYPYQRPKKSSTSTDFLRFPRISFSNDTLNTFLGASTALRGIDASPFSLKTSTDSVKANSGDDDYIDDIVSAKKKLEIKAKRKREAGDSLIEDAKRIEKRIKLVDDLLNAIKK